MKTKLFFAFFLAYSVGMGAQSNTDSSLDAKKFYFPAASIGQEKEYEKNLQNLVSQVAPLEINEKTQKFTTNADAVYLLQNNYKGLLNYAATEGFPKENLPLKIYAEAMIADPTQGNLFRKSFTEKFSTAFAKTDEANKTSIANSYFDEKMLADYQKMQTNLKEQISKNKSDSISYKNTKKLISFEALNKVSKIILPLGKNAVKGYLMQYLQPYITGDLFMSVVKPAEVSDFPDITKEYKIVFELIDFSGKDDRETAYKNINSGLLEAGRLMNLNIASGIPADQLKVVFVVHGEAIHILMNDKIYQENHQVANPNLALIKQMQSKGAKFIVCGQQMTWYGYKLSNLTEHIAEAYSAKTALINYQTQGYILNKVKLD